jgi:hypothetical protein
MIAVTGSKIFANVKRTVSGRAAFSIAKVDPGTREIAGLFETVQHSGTDLDAKARKEVMTFGICNAQCQ